MPSQRITVRSQLFPDKPCKPTRGSQVGTVLPHMCTAGFIQFSQTNKTSGCSTHGENRPKKEDVRVWCVTTTGQRAVYGVPRTRTPPSNVRPVVTCTLHVPSKIKHVEREMHGSSSAYVSTRTFSAMRANPLRRTKRFATYAVQWAGAETFTYDRSCRDSCNISTHGLLSRSQTAAAAPSAER